MDHFPRFQLISVVVGSRNALTGIRSTCMPLVFLFRPVEYLFALFSLFKFSLRLLLQATVLMDMLSSIYAFPFHSSNVLLFMSSAPYYRPTESPPNQPPLSHAPANFNSSHLVICETLYFILVFIRHLYSLCTLEITLLATTAKYLSCRVSVITMFASYHAF